MIVDATADATNAERVSSKGSQSISPTAKAIARALEKTLSVCPPASGVDEAMLTRMCLADYEQKPDWLIEASFARVRSKVKQPLRFAHIAEAFEWCTENETPPRDKRRAPEEGSSEWRRQSEYDDARVLIAWICDLAVAWAYYPTKQRKGTTSAYDLKQEADLITGPALAKAKTWIEWAARVINRVPDTDIPIKPVEALVWSLTKSADKEAVERRCAEVLNRNGAEAG